MRNISNRQDYHARGWSARLRQLYGVAQPFIHWAPALSGGLAFGVSFIQSTFLRFTDGGRGCFFVLICCGRCGAFSVGTRPWSFKSFVSIAKRPGQPDAGRRSRFPRILYSFLLLGALRPLILTLKCRACGRWLLLAHHISCACLIAWRNSRLWYCEATEYEGTAHRAEQMNLAGNRKVKENAPERVLSGKPHKR